MLEKMGQKTPNLTLFAQLLVLEDNWYTPLSIRLVCDSHPRYEAPGDPRIKSRTKRSD